MQNYGFLGIDVSKGMSNFVLCDFSGQVLEDNFQLDDNYQGHKSLIELVKEWKRSHELVKIIVGLESTGGYENNWYNALKGQSRKLGLEVFRINPKRIYFESKTEGRRSITDGVSALIIANYLRKNYGHQDLSPDRLKQVDSANDSARKLYKYVESLIKQSTRTKNTLEKLLYTYIPELLGLKPEKYTRWFLEMLHRYPSISDILNADVEGLAEIRFLSKIKAKQIIDALNQSVGEQADQYIQMAIREQVDDILRLEAKIKKVKKALAEQVKETQQESLEILTSIPGIGIDTGVSMLLEMGDLGRFEKGGNLVAFWGINPTIKQSGDRKYKMRMSKQGSPTARAILYMGAQNVVLHGPYFKAIYAKQRQKGKSHNEALGVVMSKLTRIAFGMLKNKKEFDSGIDVLNKTKQPKKEGSKKLLSKERRYQNETEIAPISRRQKQKRKQGQSASNDT